MLYATDGDGQEVKLTGTDAGWAMGPHWTLADPRCARMDRYYSVLRSGALTRFAEKCSRPIQTPTRFLGCRYLSHPVRAPLN